MSLTLKQLTVLKNIAAELEEAGIPYQISGGAAAILHGVKRNTIDIDIDLGRKDFPSVKRIFRKWMVKDYHKYFDSEDMDFDLWMMEFEIDGVPVEFGQVEDAKILGVGRAEWIELTNSLNNAVNIDVEGEVVKVQSKKDLIEYKKILSRKVDIQDVEELSVMI